MKTLFYISILFCVYSCDCISHKDIDLEVSPQKKHWVFTGSPYLFQVNIDTNARGSRTIPSIEITHQSTAFRQVLHPNSVPSEMFLDSNDIVKTVDVNFDSYPDIMVLNWLSTNLQTDYDYWLFDSVATAFVRDTQLTGYWNPTFDSINKTITSKARIGCCDYENYLLSWTNDSLHILEKENISANPLEPHPNNLYFYQEIRINEEWYIGKAHLQRLEVIDTVYNGSGSLHFLKSIPINGDWYLAHGKYIKKILDND